MPLPQLKRPTITDYFNTASDSIRSKINSLGKDYAEKAFQQVANSLIEPGIVKHLQLENHRAVISPNTPHKVSVFWNFQGDYNLLQYAAPDGTIPKEVKGSSFSEVYEYPGSIVASSGLRDEVATRIKTRTAFLTTYVNKINTAVAEHNRTLREEIPVLVADISS